VSICVSPLSLLGKSLGKIFLWQQIHETVGELLDMSFPLRCVLCMRLYVSPVAVVGSSSVICSHGNEELLEASLAVQSMSASD
jgi:hypothetical protein